VSHFLDVPKVSHNVDDRPIGGSRTRLQRFVDRPVNELAKFHRMVRALNPGSAASTAADLLMFSLLCDLARSRVSDTSIPSERTAPHATCPRANAGTTRWANSSMSANSSSIVSPRKTMPMCVTPSR